MDCCTPGRCPDGIRSSSPRIRLDARLTRRQALGALGASALALAFLRDGSGAQSASPPPMALVRNGEAAALTRAAIEALGGMHRFVSANARVVIKPNIGWDRTPEQGANTHPEVVGALVELAIAAGAREVKVMDHTCSDARRSYQRSGIEARAKAAGAQVIHLHDGRGTEMKIGGDLLAAWPVHREVVEADVLINVPVVKHHSLCRVTLGMKNWLGAIDGRRNSLHQEIGRASAELAAFFRPALTVVDATRMLQRNGPLGGNTDDVAHPRALFASVDPVAAEAFGASLMGIAPDELPQIALTEEHGLGKRDWDRPELVTVDLES